MNAAARRRAREINRADRGHVRHPRIADRDGLARHQRLRKPVMPPRANDSRASLYGFERIRCRQIAETRASEAQCAEVLQRRKAGESLRSIAEQMTLGVNTVRTIIDSSERKDRTTKKRPQRFERIEIDRQEMVRWKRQKRIGDALPGRAQRIVEKGEALIKEAKGLGRARITGPVGV